MLVQVFKWHFISILIKPWWTERYPFKQILSKLTWICGEWNKLKKSARAPRTVIGLNYPDQHHLALEPHPLPLGHGAPFKLSPGSCSCSVSSLAPGHRWDFPARSFSCCSQGYVGGTCDHHFVSLLTVFRDFRAFLCPGGTFCAGLVHSSA